MNIDTQQCRQIASQFSAWQKWFYFDIFELDQRHHQITDNLLRIQQFFQNIAKEAEQTETAIHPTSQTYFKTYQEFTPLSDFLGKKSAFKIGAALIYHADYSDRKNEHATLKTEIGNFKAQGNCEFGIWEDYKIDPHVKAQANAEVSLLESKATATLGVPRLNVTGSVKGVVGSVKAGAKAVANLKEQTIGFHVGATALEGEVKCAFHISKITITLTGSKALGTIGAEAEYSHKNREWEIGSKLGFIVGLGLKVNVKY